MEGLVNMMEETVLEKINQLWVDVDYCKCNTCRMDVATYALNRLPSRYVNSLKGAMLHKFDSRTIQMDAEITACVLQAIRMVGESPSHDLSEKQDTPSDM